MNLRAKWENRVEENMSERGRGDLNHVRKI